MWKEYLKRVRGQLAIYFARSVGVASLRAGKFVVVIINPSSLMSRRMNLSWRILIFIVHDSSRLPSTRDRASSTSSDGREQESVDKTTEKNAHVPGSSSRFPIFVYCT